MTLPNTFYAYLFVAVGGALGAMARYALNVSLQQGAAVPWGTFASNLAGCLLMGVIMQLVASTAWFSSLGMIPDQYRLLFAVGFCGSFTTLSALVFELSGMLQRNELLLSFAYLVGTLIGGFLSFYAGAAAVRALSSSSAIS